jgi:para-nitrobenzyl esterase
MVCQQDGVEKLEDEMAGAWAAFAHTGNPNHKGLAEWPAFTKDNHATMVFCDDSRARIDFDTELINTKNACDPSFEEKMAALYRTPAKK